MWVWPLDIRVSTQQTGLILIDDEDEGCFIIGCEHGVDVIQRVNPWRDVWVPVCFKHAPWMKSHYTGRQTKSPSP